jgi:radical SAM superfamily enzyme YgiQ (UPF0313 family)
MNSIKSVALVDLKVKGTKANRDHTGGFGSHMESKGVVGGIVSSLKESLIDLPILHFGTLAAMFRSKGVTVNFYDGETQGEDLIFVASSMHCYTEEVGFVREEKIRFPQSKIGFFGAFSKVKPEFFDEVADFIIMGEPETSVEAFFNSIHEFDGHLDHGIVKDMDTLPIPDWKGHDISAHSYFPLLFDRPFMSIQSSRGCSFNCDFCPYMVTQTKKYRRRSPKLVVDEIEKLHNERGVRSILFRDICFTLNKKHARSIAEEIIERSIKIHWACETRIDCLDDELIDILVESGMVGVNIGLETGNIDILKDSGKKSPEISIQEKVISYLHKKGVRINAFYMLGLVGDTRESMEDTIKYAHSLNTTGAQFCTMTPFPGTELYDRLEDKLMTKDFTQFNEYQPVVDIKTATPDEVIEAASKSYRYYIRSDWFLAHSFKIVRGLLSNRLGKWSFLKSSFKNRKLSKKIKGSASWTR